jgi:hypothetical protein
MQGHCDCYTTIIKCRQMRSFKYSYLHKRMKYMLIYANLTMTQFVDQGLGYMIVKLDSNLGSAILRH